MKNLGTWLRRRRAGVLALGSTVLVAVSYFIACELHESALRQLNAGKAHIARADWLAAIRCLDAALRLDRSLSEAHLLRATAINEYIFANGKRPPGHDRGDALVDLDLFLGHRPDSGEAHYQRALALTGLAKVEAAREAFARAIPLLADPTDALVERAGLSFHVRDYATAVDEMTGAIESHPFVPEYYEARALYRRFVQDQRGARRDEAVATRLREASKKVTLEELKALERDEGDDRPVSEPQDSPAVAAERTRFLGEWKVVAQEAEGTSMPTGERNFSINFDEKGYTLVVDGKIRQQAPFLVDPAPRRRRIDWVATIRGKKVTLLGIYEFRAGTLLICMGNLGEARPVDLATDDLDTARLYTLRPSGR